MDTPILRVVKSESEIVNDFEVLPTIHTENCCPSCAKELHDMKKSFDFFISKLSGLIDGIDAAQIEKMMQSPIMKMLGLGKK
jgi:hypothetical protein